MIPWLARKAPTSRILQKRIALGEMFQSMQGYLHACLVVLAAHI